MRRRGPLGAPEVRSGVAVLAPVAVLVAAVTGCASVDDEISFGSHGTPFSVAYAEVADDWKLVTGGEPERELGIDQWEVLGDVVATNIGDEAREIHLEFVFSLDGEEVTTATCVSAEEDVAPGESVPLGCAGPTQVVPTDFDRITVRALS